jgi:hypothetical protein
VPCRTSDTLRKKFKQELALGRERMVNLLGHKVLEIALSDRPSNLSACLALLRILDPRWREPKEATENPEASGIPTGAVIYPRKDLERSLVPATIIDVEPEPESAPAARPR